MSRDASSIGRRIVEHGAVRIELCHPHQQGRMSQSRRASCCKLCDVNGGLPCLGCLCEGRASRSAPRTQVSYGSWPGGWDFKKERILRDEASPSSVSNASSGTSRASKSPDHEAGLVSSAEMLGRMGCQGNSLAVEPAIAATARTCAPVPLPLPLPPASRPLVPAVLYLLQCALHSNTAG